MLYHVSPTGGLKTLQPRVSTHGKAYVYATENMITSLLFGTKKDDFDFIICTDEKGVPVVYECYPGALEKVYRGKSCFIYRVDETDFQRGKTSWDAEQVSEKEVAVLEEIPVADMYQRLLEEEKNKMVKMHRYEHSPEYRKKIASHITVRMILFQIDLNRCMEQDARFAAYYKEIVQALSGVMDGHLLQ